MCKLFNNYQSVQALWNCSNKNGLSPGLVEELDTKLDQWIGRLEEEEFCQIGRPIQELR